ncbi:hypothetical protein [Streptomyces sp. NPDC055681]
MFIFPHRTGSDDHPLAAGFASSATAYREVAENMGDLQQDDSQYGSDDPVLPRTGRQQKSGEAHVDGHDQRDDSYDTERHPASWMRDGFLCRGGITEFSPFRPHNRQEPALLSPSEHGRFSPQGSVHDDLSSADFSHMKTS